MTTANTHSTNVRTITPAHPEWPAEQIARLPEAERPAMLWLNGPLLLTEALARSVAITGARACTPYGCYVAGDFARGFTEQGWTTLAGGALGIDEAAHSGALAAGGRTVAVLSCGIDMTYPRANARLLEQIRTTGLLVSAHRPGTHPSRSTFRGRARLLAALGRAAVIVESANAAKSEEIGEVAAALYAVPGPLTSQLSMGTNRLLAAGARPALTTAGIIADLAP